MHARLLLSLVSVVALFGLVGCDILGLDDDDDGGSTPVVPPPELVVPEPIEALPTPRVLFYKGRDVRNPESPLDFVFSYLFESRTVLRQSSGLSTQVKGIRIPLGRERYTEGYVVLYENQSFLLGQTNTDILIRLSNFDDLICEENGYYPIHDGVGFLNTDIITWAPGEDQVCGTEDDSYPRINLTAVALDEPEESNVIAYKGTAFHDAYFNLAGWLIQEGNNIAVYNPEFERVREFTNLDDSRVIEPLRYGEQLLLLLDNELYLTDSDTLASNTPMISLVELDENRLDLGNTQIQEDLLWVLDNSLIREVNLTSGDNRVITNLSGVFQPEGRLQAGTDYLYLKSDDQQLYRIDPENGGSENLMLPSNRLYGQFLAAGSVVYFTSVDSSDNNRLRARIMMENDTQAPLCEGEGVSVDQEGCHSYSRWMIMRRLTDNGLDYQALRFQGNESQRVVDEELIIFPPQQGFFLNNAELIGYVPGSATPQISIGELGGYTQLDNTGIIEVTNGLFTAFTDSDPEADMYYFNTSRTRSLIITSRTTDLIEDVINETL